MTAVVAPKTVGPETAVLRVLTASRDWVSGKTIADATGLSRRDIRGIVHRLVVRGGSGIVTKLGSGGGYKVAADDAEIDACRRQLQALADSIQQKANAYQRRLNAAAAHKTNQLQLEL